MNSPESLVASLRTAVQAAPGDVPLRLHLAELLDEQGDSAEAVRHVGAALHADPGDEDARSLMRRLLGGERPEAAPFLATLSPRLRLGRGAGAGAPSPAGPARRDHAPVGYPSADARELPHERAAAIDAPVTSPGPAEPDPAPVVTLGEPAMAPVPPVSPPAPDVPAAEPVFRPWIPERVLAPEPSTPVYPVDGPEPADLAWPVERAGLTLDDVGGMGSAKERLDAALLAPIRDPELRRLHRKSLTGGVLLYGSPGSGKTFLARAVAGELGARFVDVPLGDVSARSDGAAELEQLFAHARSAPPVLIYLDHLEQLRPATGTGHAVAARTLAHLVTELDRGVGSSGVYVLAATTAPWLVDPALRRGGRFERTLFVVPPDQEAREVIIRQELHGEELPATLVAELALRTDGYSGADLERVVALAVARRDAGGRPRPLTEADLHEAAAEVAPSTRAWLDEAARLAPMDADPQTYVGLAEYLRSRRRG